VWQAIYALFSRSPIERAKPQTVTNSMVPDSLQPALLEMEQYPSLVWDKLLLSIGAAESGRLDMFDGFTEAEWADFLAISDVHWVSPFLYKTCILRQKREACIPFTIRRGFQRSYRLSCVRAQRAEKRLVPILKKLHAEGISVIALKGVHLATQIYVEPALRPMMDADLLVQRSDLEAAVRVIESFGYLQTSPGGRFQTKQESSVRKDTPHLPVFRIPNGPSIELHYDLEAPQSLPGLLTEGLWKRACATRVGEADVLVLSPEDTLLHLCIHAAHHHKFALKLSSLCDIPVVLSHWRGKVDWEIFWQRAKDWGVERSAMITFALTGYRLGYPLPAGILRILAMASTTNWAVLMRIAERQMQARAAILAQRHHSVMLAIKQGKPIPSPGASEEALIAFLCIPTLPGRLRFITGRIFLPKQELLARFGLSGFPFIFPLLYPARLATLVFRHMPLLLRTALKRTVELFRPLNPLNSVDLANEKVQLSTWLTGMSCSSLLKISGGRCDE